MNYTCCRQNVQSRRSGASYWFATLLAGLFVTGAALPVSADEVSPAGIITPTDDMNNVLSKARADKLSIELLTTSGPIKGIVIDLNEKLVVLKDPNKFINNVFVIKKDSLIGISRTVAAKK